DLVPFSFYGLLGVALVAIDRQIDDPFARNGIVLGIGLLVALDFWPSNQAFARSVPAGPIRELARNLADLDGDGATLRVGMYPWYTRDDWIQPTFAVSGSDVGLAWGWLDWQAGRQWGAYIRTAISPRMDALSDELSRLARIKYFIEETNPSHRLRMTDPWQLHWANDRFALWERPDVLPVAYAAASYVITTADAATPAVAAGASPRKLIAVAAPAGATDAAELARGALRTLDSPADADAADAARAERFRVGYRRPAPEHVVLEIGEEPVARLAF